MKYKSLCLDIEMRPDIGPNHVYFTFKGKFSEAASIAATKVMCDTFEIKKDITYTFTWDCRDMTGFEPAARKAWYGCMKENKPKLAMINVISDHLLIRSAAKVMLEFFGIKSTIYRDNTELKQKI